MKFQIHLIFALVIFFCRLDAHAQTIVEAADHQVDPAEQTSGSDGIIGSQEVLDSPNIHQSHMNSGDDPTTDILSTHFLRDYITNQVESFKYLGSEQDYFLPWALDRTKHYQTTDWITKLIPPSTYRYNIERRKVPRYRYKYGYVTKTIYVRIGGSSSSPRSSSSEGPKRSRAGKLVKRKVRVREVVSVRQVGVTTIKVKVPHPKGKYKQESPGGEIRLPITKSTGLAQFAHGWYAANAQIVFTMIKAGVPTNDPQIRLTVQSLNNLLFAYGIPDSTDDVAWLTALYANLPQTDLAVKEWTEKLVSRLISSSAQVGPNEGMWGPVCINPKYLNDIVEYDAKFVAKYITPLEYKIRMEQRDRTKKRLQEDLYKKEQLYEKWRRVYLTWGMGGNTAGIPRATTLVPAESKGQKNFFFNYSLKVPGQLQDAYHFQFTDLESTCIALFALSEAKVAGVLPGKTLVPTDHKGKALVEPLDVQKQLAQCYRALKSLRQKSGGWDSCYSSVFHKICRDLPYSSTIPKTLYNEIKSTDHWAFHVMGLCSMEYLARIVQGSRGQLIRKEIQTHQDTVINRLLNLEEPLNIRKAPGKENILYFLADIVSSQSKEARFLWQQIGALTLEESEYIATMTIYNGYTSDAAKQSILAEAKHFEINRPDAQALAMEPAANPAVRELMKLHRIGSLCKRAAGTYFLSRGIRQPVFAAVRPSGNITSLPALDYFVTTKNKGNPLNYFYVSSVSDIPYYSTSLFLVAETGESLMLDDAQKKSLVEYILNHQGTIVFAGLTGEDLEAAQKEFSTVLAEAGIEAKQQTTRHRGCSCVEYHVDHELIGIFLDASADEKPKDTYSKRLKVYKSLLDEKLPKGYLGNSYCLLQGKTSTGELKLTGIEWESEDKNNNQ